MQKQLPRDIHPTFKALRDCEKAATVASRMDCTEGSNLRSLALECDERSRVVQGRGSNDEEGYDDDNIPLYANS